MSINVTPIKAYTDNYIWCIQNTRLCCVVDPGDASPVLAHCQSHQLTLTHILITHHHWDHTNGIDDLLVAFPDAQVIGPHNPKITQITHRVKHDQVITIEWAQLALHVLEVPGHTLDHIAYMSSLGVFCGDTLFSAGCGRLFEGTATQMHQSLSKLATLPPATKVYCTHEYTQSNLNFALAVDTNNQQLNEYQTRVHAKRNQGEPSLPSTIGQELAINPFLRCQQPSVIKAVTDYCNKPLTSPEQVFAELRHWKDQY